MKRMAEEREENEPDRFFAVKPEDLKKQIAASREFANSLYRLEEIMNSTTDQGTKAQLGDILGDLVGVGEVYVSTSSTSASAVFIGLVPTVIPSPEIGDRGVSGGVVFAGDRAVGIIAGDRVIASQEDGDE